MIVQILSTLNQVGDIKYSFLENFKKSKLIKNLNIYPAGPGKIAKSGWHSKIINLKNDIIGDWVFTTMCIYKSTDIRDLKFDETFGQYSYLEDLDFLKFSRKLYFISPTWLNPKPPILSIFLYFFIH